MINEINKNSKSKGTRGPNFQYGLSLIELMISMVIGLFLLGGVITNFIGTKDSDRMRSAISEMDANARVALATMRQTILHAGYPSIHNMLIDKGFYAENDPDINNPTCRDGSLKRDISSFESIDSDDLATKDRSRGDVITVIALADNPCKAGKASCPNEADVNPDAQVYIDCMGGGVDRDARTVACSADPDAGLLNPSDAKIYSSFRLGGGTSSRTLFCDGSRGGTQPIVDNIEAMQILYGVQKADGTVIYHNATRVDTDNEWGAVTSVQIALLLRSSRDILSENNSKTQYTLLDKDWDVATSDLKRLFKVYTTTIHLANQNKGGIL